MYRSDYKVTCAQEDFEYGITSGSSRIIAFDIFVKENFRDFLY